MLLQRKRVILAKIETPYGTDSTPTGSANAILVRNLEVTPLSADIVARDAIRPYMGNVAQIIAARYVTVTFEVELAGAGAAGTAPAYGPLLRACGMSETVVAATRVDYKPISASFESVTIYLQPQDERVANSPLHKATGCRGNVEFTLNAKQLPVAKFTFTGLYNAVADVANLTVNYAAFQTPIAVNQGNTPAFSFFSYSAPMAQFGLNVGNEVTYRNLVNSENVLLTDRKAGGTVVFEAPTITQKDYFSIALGSALGSMTLTHGTTAGGIVEIVATNTVDIAQPTYAEADGVVMMSVPYVLVPTTAGNDEFTLTVK